MGEQKQEPPSLGEVMKRHTLGAESLSRMDLAERVDRLVEEVRDQKIIVYQLNASLRQLLHDFMEIHIHQEALEEENEWLRREIGRLRSEKGEKEDGNDTAR